MLRKSAILAVLLALGIFATLSASAVPGSDLAVAPVSAGSAASGQAGDVAPLALFSSEPADAASCSASPLFSAGNPGVHTSDACITHGNTCDPRYVQDPVCCPPYHCQYLYPGVPLLCV